MSKIIKRCWRIVLLIHLFLIFFMVVTTVKVQPFQEKQLEITYIANAGFLIEYKSKKILIDALHSWPNFQSTPDEVFNDMRNSRPPFNNIDLVLVTHRHPDHFHPDMVELFLINNPNAMMIASPIDVEFLRIASDPQFGRIAKQVKIVDAKIGDVIELSVNGIDLQIFALEHNGRQTMLNLGFLIKIGDKTLLHEGDANISNEYFQSANFELEYIDILFENDYFRKDRERQKIIRDHIKPKHRIAMHIKPEFLEDYSKEIKKKFPDEIIFKKPMEKRVFK
ncbi:MBL fold metallo-hydrolase [candidate division KSB1 bacterium]